MTIALIILIIFLLIVGIVGCIVPGLPGVPLSYLAMWIVRWAGYQDKMSYTVLLVWGLVTIVATVLDYVVPAWGTKKFGGSRWGVWGSTIGLIFGLFCGPWGIILGPFLGAVLFELIGGKTSDEALRAGWGSFVGLLTGTIIKLICCGLMTYQVCVALL